MARTLQRSIDSMRCGEFEKMPSAAAAAVKILFACLVLRGAPAIEPGKGVEDQGTVEIVSPHYDSVETESEPEDVSWVPEAVLDVAYYLRKHKNNGYDPRYLTESAMVARDLYLKFPDPPLRTLNWEVRKNCEKFLDCLKYLQDKVSLTELPRHMDSLTVVRHNGWTMDRDVDLMRATDNACVELRDRDEKTFNVFSGPLQKFQWLTTASYYMCWYAIKGETHLANFVEPCDNFANCIDWDTGPSNGDIRARNELPFACATYSFCPDPCCPARLVTSSQSCASVNPCAKQRNSDETCTFVRKRNVDFDSIVYNKWNVSCHCDEPGMRWESRSGQCVDVDECAENQTICNFPSESCMNLPGGYSCVCSLMGYQRRENGSCVRDPILHRAIYPPKFLPGHKNKTAADSFFDFVYRVKDIFSVSQDIESSNSDDEPHNVTSSTETTNAELSTKAN